MKQVFIAQCDGYKIMTVLNVNFDFIVYFLDIWTNFPFFHVNEAPLNFIENKKNAKLRQRTAV